MATRMKFSTSSLPLRTPRRPAGREDVPLLDLIRLRVSQIHGCQLGESHYRAKLELAGEATNRLDELDTWPVSGVYTAKERMALALAELLAQPSPGESTLLPRLLSHAREQLTRAELVRLVVAVEAIQDWEHREDLHA